MLASIPLAYYIEFDHSVNRCLSDRSNRRSIPHSARPIAPSRSFEPIFPQLFTLLFHEKKRDPALPPVLDNAVASEQQESHGSLRGFTSSTVFPSEENHFRSNWLRISEGIKLQKKQEKDKPTVQAQYRSVNMASLLNIRPFKRLLDGSEDPEEFLDDVQAAAEGWNMS